MKNCMLMMCCLLAVLTACGEKATDMTTVSGEIKGLGNDTLYLYGTDRMYNRIDTIYVENGKFSISLPIDTLISASLLLNDGNTFPLFLNKGEKIRIKGTTDTPEMLNISGNPQHDELAAFLQELQTAQSTEEEAVEKASLFIQNHPTSLVSIYLLERYFVQQPHPNYIRIKELGERMSGELKDRPYMEDLLKRLREKEKSMLNKVTPYFQVPNAEGKRIGRNNFRNQYLLVHFWASWHPQSRKENAALRTIYDREEKNKKFAMMGVSFDLDKQEWLKALEQDTLKWEQTCDFKAWESNIAKQLSIESLPSNILLAPNGKIEGRDLTIEEIEQKLKEIKEP